MKVVFYSNFLNHHQLPFCLAMQKLTKNQFTFVATEPIPQERLSMGYYDMNKSYPFVLTTYDFMENEMMARELAVQCDVMITGSAPEIYTEIRMRENRLTFRYYERVYKEGLYRALRPRSIASQLLHHTRFARKQLYVLCASSYTAFDFSLTGAYVGKTYKWGYFPEVKKQDKDMLFEMKHIKKRPVILWVGRLIPWKHPETMIELAHYLKSQGKLFDINIIGNGELEEKLSGMIRERQLEDCVHMLGAMSPEAVRNYMEMADIFTFTSDYNEGWGAVLNESMCSGCAVIASHAIGAAGFLIEHGKNGFIYPDGEQARLNEMVIQLLDNASLREKLGREACKTLETEWNAETAAQRLLDLCEVLQKGEKTPFKTGPCSAAARISNGRARREARKTESVMGR